MPNARPSRPLTVTLWILAFVIVVFTAGWQRRTGPSYPLRGTIELAAGESLDYRLVRNETTDTDAVVELPHTESVDSVELHYRRHGTGEAFTVVEMTRAGDTWSGALPRQPAAGKLDYFLVANGEVRIPAGQPDHAVIRYKDPVPAGVLIPHILMMFLSMLCGVRAAIAAFSDPLLARRLARVTLGCLTLGGLMLGPIVQKYAFGAFWTGWPVGEDLTDTKTLVIWAGWLFAVLVVRAGQAFTARSRAAIVFAVVVMIAMYLVPHSMRGSTLDYDLLEEGVPVEDAIRTG
jgi:hypothetical protein